MSFTDKMRERAPTGWTLGKLQSMTGWAEELRAIPSTTVSGYRQLLIQCDARLASLSQPSTALVTEATPPRKSSRSSKKGPVDVPEASVVVSPKAREVFISTQRVCVIDLRLFILLKKNILVV
jgi:hypothetical protein